MANHMTGAERYNARQEKIWDAAKRRSPELFNEITKAYVRYYSDNEQFKIYVELSNGARVEGDIGSLHMAALLKRAQREGKPCTFESW
jgi:hypothetical protein